MNRLISMLFLLMLSTYLFAQSKSEIFEFEFEGITLNGMLNFPANQTPKGIVLLVQGSGRTNAVAGNAYGDVRETLVQAGYTTYIWDKMGCGKSGGTFNYNQPVKNSAQEAIAAIHALQEKEIPGAQEIGLWGVSRAGWINPLVIKEYKDIKFWISVSGVDDKENFGYLLEKNLSIDGYPQDTIDLIVKEWYAGNQICHSGGSYESCVAATTNLSKNPFMKRFNGGNENTEAEYYAFQKEYMKEEWDEVSNLHVIIKDFPSLLSQVECPVLALFGEKDMNVDWEKTKALYEKTIGPNTDLSIKSFPNCNHNLYQCETGGFYEFQDNQLPWNRCDGFLDAMKDWLAELD